MSALVFQTAAQLSDQLAAGQLSAVELAQACLAQVRATDERLNAFLSLDEADILAKIRKGKRRIVTGRLSNVLFWLPRLFH